MTEFGDRIKKELFRKLIPTIEILQGGIYKVADFDDNPIVKFPADNLPETHPQSNRTFHRQRYVLVVQDNGFNSDNNVISVLVVPLTHSGRETQLSVEIPTKYLDDSLPDSSFALVYLTQPILKVFLEAKVGFVAPNDTVFDTIRSIYLQLLGLL